MKQIQSIILTALLCCMPMAAVAQSSNASSTRTEQEQPKKHKKAWEFGIGGSVMQLNRMYLTNFQKHDAGYDFDMKMKHALWGGDLYVARELNKYFYLDATAGMGGAKVYNLEQERKTRFYYTAGLGLQWRLSPYFKSKYIDPYFRVGVHYLHREFMVDYSGLEGENEDVMKWVLQNSFNRDGMDVRNMVAVAGGFGVNMWFNNHVGIGAQINYMYMPRVIKRQKHVADALQGSLRLIFRVGGEDKNAKAAPIYIEKIVEKPVERIVEVEKIVKVKERAFAMLNNVFFHFDTATFIDSSHAVLDEVAELLKELDSDRHFLIVGYTDSRGSQSYNLNLSRRRAAAVVKALEERGVPDSMLKSRGVGKRVAIVDPKENHSLREADRKVSIEEILDEAYWNYIPKKDY